MLSLNTEVNSWIHNPRSRIDLGVNEKRAQTSKETSNITCLASVKIGERMLLELDEKQRSATPVGISTSIKYLDKSEDISHQSRGHHRNHNSQ